MTDQEIIGQAIKGRKLLTKCSTTEAADAVFRRLAEVPGRPVAVALSADLRAYLNGPDSQAQNGNGRP